MNDAGVPRRWANCWFGISEGLLKNTVEQSFTEKFRSLLIFGPNSRRYKDFFDMYYLKDIVDKFRFY